MPTIKVNHASQLTPDKAFQRIKDFFSNEEETAKLGQKLSCDYDDKKLTGKIKGSQFKADLAIQKVATGCEVLVTVDIPLMLTPFKGKIQEILERKMSKFLAS